MRGSLWFGRAAQLTCVLLVVRLIWRQHQLGPRHRPLLSTFGRSGLTSEDSQPSWHNCVGNAGLCGLRPGLRRQCFGDDDERHLSVQYSLLAGIRDRPDALYRALPSWLAVRGLDELIIVDWGSVVPLHGQLPPDGRLRVVSVPMEREWNLARAYNLAAQFARGKFILKVDSDTRLAPGFLEAHLLHERAFYAGDWRRAPDENAWHLNGVVLLRREHFFTIGGYDERFRGYGWDDTDLCAATHAVGTHSMPAWRYT